MRRITFVFFLLYCLSAYPSRDVDSIIIRFVSWERGGSPHITSCVNFEYDVPYKEYPIKDPKAIKKISESIREATLVEKRDFSVGCKLLFVRGNSVVKIIALNSDYMLQNGEIYSCPLDLIEIINNLMAETGESKELYHYLPDRFGNEYKKGRNVLYHKLLKHLNKQEVFTETKGDVRLVAYCHADRWGKTTKILQLNVYNESLTDREIKMLEQDIYGFFKKIKWKKNDTRMNCDFIKIMFRFPLRR